jgi:4,5-DOPA dioxygenase extradiol
MKRKNFIKTMAMLPIASQFMNLTTLYNLTSNSISSEKLPVMFVGHGNPMNAIENNSFVRGWKKISSEINNIKAILCISAHWETKGSLVTAMEHPRTIHDFGGFPQTLFDVQYRAPGDPLLAGSIQNSFAEHIALDHQWGLDHGCWSVLKNMYPEANIPVLQLSLNRNFSPVQHYDLAKQLSVLRNKGVLIIGSGNMVHNLGILDWNNPNEAYEWATNSNQIIKSLISERKHTELINYNNLGKDVRLAIPTPEHYLPLLYVLAMQGQDEQARFFNDEIVMGSISMTSFGFGLN